MLKKAETVHVPLKSLAKGILQTDISGLVDEIVLHLFLFVLLYLETSKLILAKLNNKRKTIDELISFISIMIITP